MPQSTSVLRRNGFAFKQFFVVRDRCAMKIGTDGILLGIWAPIVGVERILDASTRSGLLVLMLAQRADENVIVDAAEPDVDAAQQAQEDIARSPRTHRVSVHTEDAQQWMPRQTVRFDLITSNPPYHEQDVECTTSQCEQVRYTTPFDRQASLMLAADSIAEEESLRVMLPEQIGSAFTQRTLSMDWHPWLRTDVVEAEARLPHRILLTFSPRAGECFDDELVTCGPDQHYSEGYTVLTQAFYLFM